MNTMRFVVTVAFEGLFIFVALGLLFWFGVGVLVHADVIEKTDVQIEARYFGYYEKATLVIPEYQKDVFVVAGSLDKYAYAAITQ